MLATAVSLGISSRHGSLGRSSSTTSTETWTFDPQLAAATLASLRELRPAPAVEPDARPVEGSESLEVVPGQTGTVVDLDSLVEDLGRIDLLDPPDVVEAPVIAEPPAITDEAAQALADDLNELTRAGAIVSIQGHSRLLSAKDLRDRLIVTIGDQGLEPSFNQVSLAELLESKFPQPVGEFTAPTFDVVDGQVRVLTPGVPYQICCIPTRRTRWPRASSRAQTGPSS